ncbi:MAG: hypothetical protein HN353_10295 [Bdellovibrionales bacterium]|mgnify:CR=1 FL=1|jgi:hypothetical protein|nr:hypothetical protein [Bdellovibrionales bacterium]MBT3527291.1 hypothetical protein [Bdellovibrionales bacterium]MBT7670343.1 hypothetical protein [Bdellovibrionales bacterium]MBT7765960.1 hypothetical protein [Bdellovibrionales bacterium]
MALLRSALSKSIASVVVTSLILTLTSWAGTTSNADLPANSNNQGESSTFGGMKYQAAWRASLGGESSSNLTDDESVVRARLTTKFNLQLSPGFIALADISLVTSQGRQQAQFGNTSYNNGFNIDQAYIQYRPISAVDLLAGAISTGRVESPLLLGSNPFPGLVERVSINLGAGVYTLEAMQAIPTSSSINSERQEKEERPILTIQKAKAVWQGVRGLQLIGSVGQFSYRNLPSKVAYNSMYKGNSVIGTQSADSQFAFEFNGYIVGGELLLTKAWLGSWNVGWQRVENLEAPVGYGRGERIYSSLNIPWRSNVLTPSVELFFNESDSSVAAYNSALYGNNNSRGYLIGFEYLVGGYDYRIKTLYRRSEPIEADGINSPEDSISINLETSYAPF